MKGHLFYLELDPRTQQEMKWWCEDEPPPLGNGRQRAAANKESPSLPLSLSPLLRFYLPPPLSLQKNLLSLSFPFPLPHLPNPDPRLHSLRLLRWVLDPSTRPETREVRRYLQGDIQGLELHLQQQIQRFRSHHVAMEAPHLWSPSVRSPCVSSQVQRHQHRYSLSLSLKRISQFLFGCWESVGKMKEEVNQCDCFSKVNQCNWKSK